jgi:hypothetical protein
MGSAIAAQEGGDQMRIAIDMEKVNRALAGIYKSGRCIFFKIRPNGEHERVNIASTLMQLGLSHGQAASISLSYPWPAKRYYSQQMKQADAARGKPKGRAALVAMNGNIEEEEPEPEEKVRAVTTGGRNCHYHLVEQGKYFGIYNGQDGGTILFTDKKQAELYFKNLLHDRENFKSFYWKPF